MQRRQFLIAGAGLLAAPRLVRAQERSTLRFVPQADLAVLDPIWTTATVTTNHGYYVFDTLYAMDTAQNPQPQMAEGHEVSPDGLTWRIRLREGLLFHDNTPVRAADAAASLNRWRQRDPFAELLAPTLESIAAEDARTVVLRLSRPFPLMLALLAKNEASAPFIMPERLAATPPTTALKEMVGSGPYRFVAGEYNSGARAVYEKFAGYRPRTETPSNAAGSKAAFFDRIEWHIIPDAATAAAALRQGEVDWWEQPLPDLLPLLQGARTIATQIADPLGKIAVMRMNCLQPPFDNIKVRRAVQLGVRQQDYMRAAVGEDASLWTESFSCFPKGTPYYEESGRALMPGDLAVAKAALKASGYAGEKVVVISPSDYPAIGALGQVTYGLLREMGFNVDLQESDWGTVVQRRAKRDPVERGGWSILHTTSNSSLNANPAVSSFVRGLGEKGWFGWWKSEAAEALVQDWLRAPGAAEQKAAAVALSRRVMEGVGTIPLGEFFVRTAFNKDISGIRQAPWPYPWTVRRG